MILGTKRVKWSLKHSLVTPITRNSEGTYNAWFNHSSIFKKSTACDLDFKILCLQFVLNHYQSSSWRYVNIVNSNYPSGSIHTAFNAVTDLCIARASVNIALIQFLAWWHHQMETFSAATGPLCEEFTCHRWSPLTKASDAELWCFFFDLRLNKRLSKQSRRRWFETPLRSLWRHYNACEMFSLFCLICLGWIYDNIPGILMFYYVHLSKTGYFH